MPARSVLDGEIVVAKNGGLDFEALQLRIHPAASRVKLLSQEIPASIVFFDLLCEGERDLRSVTFQRRRRELESLLSSAIPPIRLTPAASEWILFAPLNRAPQYADLLEQYASLAAGRGDPGELGAVKRAMR